MAGGTMLTKEQLRNASPIEQLPWELVRKGAKAIQAKPAYYSSFGDAQRAMLRDLDKFEKEYKVFLRESDLARIGEVRGMIGLLTEPTDGTVAKGVSFGVEGVIDEYSGLKYSAAIVRR